MTKLVTAAALLALLVLAPRPARADDIARGTIVKIEAREIYVNLGQHAGVVEGARLRIKRPVKLRHPVTRAWITDWLPLGAADVRSAGTQLSMAVLDDDLLAQVAVGDVVEIYVEREEARDAAPAPPPEVVPDAAPLPVVDDATAAVLDTWERQSGTSVDARITAWESYLASHADSPYADAVREDLDVLRRLRDTMAPPDRGSASRRVSGVEHAAPTRAHAGDAVPLVFVLDDPAAVSSAWLHYRRLGDRAYDRALLARDGSRYLRGEIPADAVTAPGLEYFVEVVGPDGAPGVAITPTEVAVDRPGLEATLGGGAERTRLRLSSTYLDFATFDHRAGDHTDQFWLTEGDVEYRIGPRLWAVRAGFGALQGKGGYADRVWQGDAPVAGFNYGYAEVEVRAIAQLGVLARLVAGVGQDGFGMGLEARARIGRPDATNLSLGVSQLAEVGFLSDVRFEVDPFGRLPVGFSVGVTDQPTRGDLAVRLGVDLGWRASRWIEPQLRLGYQGRTVAHAGVGAGLGLAFHW
ncbi:MAG: hypothetical protein H6709_03490 [Kofleriaceae bacterium]|nr:hypothetical protein [Myxococcales bacterium]MCB9571133.1 hypothetical protein [Kofleriaceae bacterium]